MGISSCKPVHARHCDGSHRRHDPRKAQGWRQRLCVGLYACLILLPFAAAAETLRIATYHTDLTRRGPGLLLRDILLGEDPQVTAALAMIAATDADVILLTGIDYDLDLVALSALADALSARGPPFPHRFALRPNTGMATGLDLDGSGRAGDPRDAQGYGRFAGEGGMAVLSRLPILNDAVRDFSAFLWRDLPGSRQPPGTEPDAAAVQRLSTTGHWEVPLALPDGSVLRLLAWHATPPVFEPRNAARNHDETAFWLRLLGGELAIPPPAAPFVLLGDANLDPVDGDGQPEAIRQLLAHPALQDVPPRHATQRDDPGHKGDPALDTADYGGSIGGLRVEYILPSRGLTVLGSGILWPPPGDALAPLAQAASRHRPLWVDIALP